jgi:prepilin-type processing-associated H-X9-DG protein
VLYHWGVGEPRRSPQQQPGSWAFAILPYLEQNNVYQNHAYELTVNGYVCPSRRIAQSYVPVGEDDVGIYKGGGWSWGKIDYAGNSLLFPRRPKCQALAVIQDGASQTILVGEKAFNPRVVSPTSWYFDEPFFLGPSASTVRGGIEIQRDGDDIDFRSNWGSAHTSGTNFLFADGSVRGLPFGMNFLQLSAFLTPDGGEVNSDPS